MDSEVGLNAAVCSLQSRVSALEASGTLPRGDFEERLSALENARQIPRALLDEYRTYFDSSLWGLFQRATKDAKAECDTVREDFHKAYLNFVKILWRPSPRSTSALIFCAKICVLYTPLIFGFLSAV